MHVGDWTHVGANTGWTHVGANTGWIHVGANTDWTHFEGYIYSLSHERLKKEELNKKILWPLPLTSYRSIV